MPRKKDYVSRLPSLNEAIPDASVDPFATLALQTHRIDLRDLLGHTARFTSGFRIDLSDWRGRGIDGWVDQSLLALIALGRSGRYAPATLRNSSHALSNWFFRFLADSAQSPICASPSELRSLHLARYVDWLKTKHVQNGLSLEATRHAWTGVKLVLKQLIELGQIVTTEHLLFPKTSLRNGNGKGKTTGLSDTELDRVATALRTEIIDHYHGRIALNESDVTVVRYLLIALRAGINTTDLIEIDRDCLRPGLLPGVMRLVRRKVRANKVIVSGVRSEPVECDVGGVPMDSVAIIRMVQRDTEQHAKEVQPHLANRLWLYRSQEPERKGLVNALSYTVLHQNTVKFVERNKLLADDGSQLVLNTSRLRKTLGLKAFRVTNGNLFSVAAVLGNTPHVAGTNYLSITHEIKRSAASYMNTEFAAFVRGGNSILIPIKVAQSGEGLDTTMVARCADSLNGSFAPQDGRNRCEKFYMCLSCPSFAIVGEVNDLWRLFSFQEFLRGEAQHADSLGAQTSGTAEAPLEHLDYLRSMIAFVDDFVGRHFAKGLIDRAKKKTEGMLHPFWRQRVERRLLQIRKLNAGG